MADYVSTIDSEKVLLPVRTVNLPQKMMTFMFYPEVQTMFLLKMKEHMQDYLQSITNNNQKKKTLILL